MGGFRHSCGELEGNRVAEVTHAVVLGWRESKIEEWRLVERLAVLMSSKI